MRGRGLVTLLVMLAMLGVTIPVASPAHADGSTDAYNQIVNGQIAGQTLPILPGGAPKYYNFGWGRYYVGPKGLEIRFTSNGSANFVKLELAIAGAYAAPVIDGAITAGAAAAVGATDAGSLANVIRGVLGVTGALSTDQIDKAIHRLILNNQCLGVTVPVGFGISSMLTRATAVMQGNLWSVITGSMSFASLWLEPCTTSLPGPADILVPMSLPGAVGIVAPSPRAGPGVGNAVYDGRNTLWSSGTSTLQAGHYIKSPDGQYVLILQTDGNLVLYGPAYTPIWASGTANYPIDRLVMQSDGNLVLYGLGSYAFWWTQTNGSGPSHLTIQDDGNAVIYTDPGPGYTWQTHTGGHSVPSSLATDRLNAGQQLLQMQYIQSTDGRIALLLQSDGNVVLYGPGYHVLWNAGTGGTRASRLVMQTDGNLVLYRPDNSWVWQSGTGGSGAAFAIAQTDGNFVVYRANGTWVWQAGTGGRI